MFILAGSVSSNSCVQIAVAVYLLSPYPRKSAVPGVWGCSVQPDDQAQDTEFFEANGSYEPAKIGGLPMLIVEEQH